MVTDPTLAAGQVRMAVDVGYRGIRVAVQVGAAAPRAGPALVGQPAGILERLGSPRGDSWLVSGHVVHSAQLIRAALAEAITAQRVGSPDQLVLVHPGWWAPGRTAALRAAVAGLATETRLVPAPAAIRAAGTESGSSPTGPVAVLDIGWTEARASVLAAGAESGELLADRRMPIGGDDLDEALLAVIGAACPLECLPRWRELSDGIDPLDQAARMALRDEIRRARELLGERAAVLVRLPDGLPEVQIRQDELASALSVPLARIADVLAAALTDADLTGDDPTLTVLLAGGVARTPQLPELLAARVGAWPTVLADPAAVLCGALAAVGPPARSPAGAAGVPAPGRRPERPPSDVPTDVPSDVPADQPTPLLPPAPRRRRLPEGLPVAVVAGLLAGAAALIVMPPSRPGTMPAPAPTPAAAATPVGTGLLAQYDYAVRLPDGWQHSGGLPERRRTLLTPSAAPDGSDLISIEQSTLGYDSDAEPARAQRELRARYDGALAGGSLLDGFLGGRFAGRAVTTYRQRQPERGALVDWHVIFERDVEISIGCQHTVAGSAAVAVACEQLVGSLRISHGR